MKAKLNWTDELLDTVKKLAEQSWSGGKIAAELSNLTEIFVTRSMVVGVCFRHKIQLHGMSGRSKENRLAARPVARLFHRVRPSTSSAVVPNRKPRPVLNPTLGPINPSIIVEPGIGPRCQFPIGDIGQPDFRFCDQNRLESSPYCEPHYRICYDRRAN